MNKARNILYAGVTWLTLVSWVQATYANEVVKIITQLYSQSQSGVTQPKEKTLPEWCTFYYESIDEIFSRRIYTGENCPKDQGDEKEDLTNK